MERARGADVWRSCGWDLSGGWTRDTDLAGTVRSTQEAHPKETIERRHD